MKEFIKFEIIRNLKRKEVKLLVVILVMCELILIAAMQRQSSNEEVYSESAYWVATDAYFVVNPPKDLEQLALKDVAIVEKGLIDYYSFEKEKNWDKLYQVAMQYCSYYGQVYSYNPSTKIDENEAEFLMNNQLVGEIQKKHNLISIEKYAEIIDVQNSYDLHALYPWAIHELEYFTSLYEKHLSPLTYSSIDSSTLFIQVLRNLLALITPILAALLFFNERKEYHEIGVDKSLMIIPKVRGKFIIGKITANTIILLIVLLGPILLMTLIFGIFDHFENLNYPLMANKKGFSELYYPFFEKIYDLSTLQECIEKGTTLNFGISFLSGNMLFNPYMDFIPLWQGILPTLVLYILLIILYVQTTMFITRIIKNPYLALTVNIALILILIVCSPLPSMNFLNTFNPLTYRDPGVNVIGTSYFPWLAGMLVVIGYNVFLFIGNKIAFKYKYYD